MFQEKGKKFKEYSTLDEVNNYGCNVDMYFFNFTHTIAWSGK